MPTLTYGTTVIDYLLYEQKRKDLKISVSLVNGIEVFAPASLEEDKLKNLLSKKAPWILGKLNELNQVEASIMPKEFVSGEKLPYLGRNYRLKVHREAVENATLSFYQGKFIATVPKKWSQEEVQDTLEKHLIHWYRERGAQKLQERATAYEKLMGVKANSISLRTQHKRWGTCTPDGDIYINWRLIMAPVKVLDYVIVHELAHLRIQDHSPEFWKIVKSILPNYETSKEWLRVNGMGLHCIG
ncbi:M48 family metallopeptidase [Virgibacillus kekensis]|uniref:M48 family metallopeptidase n=1 Tax=Virgibacillus kekensis TaxID=202261 RepID=A0ABV9DN99_9BACI